MGYRGCFDHRSETEPIRCDVDFQRCRTLQAPLYQRFGQRIFDVLLQCPPQRTRAIIAISQGFLEDPLPRFRRQYNLYLAVDQRVVDLANQQINDAEQFFFTQRIEQNNFIQAVQELGIEHALHFAEHQVVHALDVSIFRRRLKTHRGPLLKMTRAEV